MISSTRSRRTVSSSAPLWAIMRLAETVTLLYLLERVEPDELHPGRSAVVSDASTTRASGPVPSTSTRRGRPTHDRRHDQVAHDNESRYAEHDSFAQRVVELLAARQRGCEQVHDVNGNRQREKDARHLPAKRDRIAAIESERAVQADDQHGERQGGRRSVRHRVLDVTVDPERKHPATSSHAASALSWNSVAPGMWRLRTAVIPSPRHATPAEGTPRAGWPAIPFPLPGSSCLHRASASLSCRRKRIEGPTLALQGDRHTLPHRFLRLVLFVRARPLHAAGRVTCLQLGGSRPLAAAGPGPSAGFGHDRPAHCWCNPGTGDCSLHRINNLYTTLSSS